MKLIVKIVLGALALLLIAEVVPGVHVESYLGAIIAALVLGLLNALVRPLVVLLTLPLTILTLGLFLLVVNAFFFALAANFVPQFSVAGFVPALLGAFGMSVAGFFINRIV
ncbi:phage holin family protein [Patescibacteria group bacterium]|nr:phage holin family protein [Patescibacteria group bacterium]